MEFKVLYSADKVTFNIEMNEFCVMKYTCSH